MKLRPNHRTKPPRHETLRFDRRIQPFLDDITLEVERQRQYERLVSFLKTKPCGISNFTPLGHNGSHETSCVVQLTKHNVHAVIPIRVECQPRVAQHFVKNASKKREERVWIITLNDRVRQSDVPKLLEAIIANAEWFYSPDNRRFQPSLPQPSFRPRRMKRSRKHFRR